MNSADFIIQETMRKVRTKLEKECENYLLTEFVKLRTSEMFNIFSDFPDSLPAINDFKYALEKTKMHNLFAT